VRSHMKKPVLIVLILALTASPSLFAQEESPAPVAPQNVTVAHALGDQAFSFSLGGFLPLFFYRVDDGVVEGTNLFIGARGALQYLTYLSSVWVFSVELNGALAFTPNFNIYWTLPILAKISYVVDLGQFELFLTMGLGVNFQSFIGYSRMDFMGRPEVTFYIPIDPTLDFGISAAYWFVPQFASKEQEETKSGQTRLGNFLDVSISLIYHF